MKWPKAFILFSAVILGLPAILIAQNESLNNSGNVNEGDSGDLQAGIASQSIPQGVKVKNWVTGDPYPEIRDSIYTRALVLSAGDQKVVLIQWDLVDAGESATARVRAKVSEALNIPEYNILVNASHNHSAPWAPVY